MLTNVSIPDMSAICTPEVELPTLSLDSSQLSPSSSPVATITLQPAHTGGYTVTTADTQVTTQAARAANEARRSCLMGPSLRILAKQTAHQLLSLCRCPKVTSTFN